MITYLRNLKRSFLNDKYIQGASRVDFLSTVVKNNPNVKSINIERDRFILVLISGMKFEWDPKEQNSCLGLATQANYEDFELSIIEDILNPNDVVLDIGANFGYFSIYLNLRYPNLSLHCFEPIKRTYDLFLRNCELNKVKPLTHNMGFSSESGVVTFYLPEKLGSAWASMGKGVKSVLKYELSEERCNVMKLDDFVAANNIAKINFIKCDVEGAEKLVVEGAERTLLANKPVLMLEIGDKWSAHFGYKRTDLIQKLLTEFGYKCFGVLKDQLREISEANDVTQYSEDIMYNYFFVHSEQGSAIKLIEKYIEK